MTLIVTDLLGPRQDRQTKEGQKRRVVPNAPSEEPARRVRCITFDNPMRFRGRDRHAPPNSPSEGPARQVRLSEGRACRVRGAKWDYACRFGGRDRHAPPSGRDRHDPIKRPHTYQLACNLCLCRSSNLVENAIRTLRHKPKVLICKGE